MNLSDMRARLRTDLHDEDSQNPDRIGAGGGDA